MSSSDSDEFVQPMAVGHTPDEPEEPAEPINLFLHAAYHITLPPYVPQAAIDANDERAVNIHMCDLAYRAANGYVKTQRGKKQQLFWKGMAKTLSMLSSYSQSMDAGKVEKDLKFLKGGDVIAFYLRAHNAGLIIRKGPTHTTFEVFEVLIPAADIMSETGKLTRAFPGPAVVVANTTAGKRGFVSELAKFIAIMNNTPIEAAPGERRDDEDRDAPHPRFVSQFLVGLLRGLGKIAQVFRVHKRLADEVLQHDKHKVQPWRRSGCWLVIRVLLQTSCATRDAYKAFMVHLHTLFLQDCVRAKLDSDVVFAVRAKMARRLYKLRNSVDVPKRVVEAAHSAAADAEGLLRDRWTRAERESARMLKWTPDDFNLIDDTNLKLVNSRQYIHSIIQDIMDPKENERADLPDLDRARPESNFQKYEGNALQELVKKTNWVALADFEQAVHDHLDSWVVHNQSREARPRACKVLASCLEQYSHAAKEIYTLDPLEQSIAALTSLRLWTAIDRMAVAHIALLGEYSPELPHNFLAPLLLRSRGFVRQSVEIDAYIRQRHQDATISTSVFASTASADTFAVRYFAQSTEMPKLLQLIRTETNVRKAEKFAELEQRAEEKVKFAVEVAQTAHRTYTSKRKADDYEPILRHYKTCPGCEKARELEAMGILVLEDPLPDDELTAQTVVFELACPAVYSIWRSATYLIADIATVDRSKATGSSAATIVTNVPGLKDHSRRHGRVTLASRSSPLANKPAGIVRVPATEEQVFVKSQMKWQLIDTSTKTFITPAKELSMAKHGTLRIEPDSPYARLEYALKQTDHSPNQVIADQSLCPSALSLHEWVAYGSLRAGPRLQWLNIVRELASNTLSLRRREVDALLSQAAWQIGELDQDGNDRECHVDLQDEDFGLRLIDVCSTTLRHAELNWLEVGSVKVLVTLVLRLFAGCLSDKVEVACHAFLRHARRVAFQWLRNTKHSLTATIDGDKSTEQQTLICEISSLVRQTFDVDADHVGDALSTSEDVSVFVEAAIALRENEPPNSEAHRMQLLFTRDRRIAHKLQNRLRSLVEQDWSSFDSAIVSVWSNYRPSRTRITSRSSHWISVHTQATPTRAQQYVDFNILTGTLLVDGMQLGRLPDDVVNNTSYIRTFGERVLEVIPSDLPGFQYTTRATINGYQVSFSQGRKALRIQAQLGDECLELVPHSQFSGDIPDLPSFLRDDYAHWLDVGSRVVYLRLLDQQFFAHATHWRIHLSDTDDLVPARMFRTNGANFTSISLLDSRSRSMQQVQKRLQRLEEPDNIIATYDHAGDGTLLVELPRYRLQFRLVEGQLESLNFRGTIIDDNQSAGCFIGLKNQLVLRVRDDRHRTLPRTSSVIIPFGDITFGRAGSHVTTFIDTRKQRKAVTYYKYDIDQDLGCLVPQSAGFTAKLFKIYLHAVTSGCLADPLSERTGTEVALDELLSGSVQSFSSLTQADLDLLILIGSLTPRRDYLHKGSTYSISWLAAVSPLSQHDAFAPAALNILRHGQNMQVFEHEVENPLEINKALSKFKRDTKLHTRAATRNAAFYPGDITTRLKSDVFLPPDDVPVDPRDRSSGSAATEWAASLVQTENPYVDFDLVDRVLVSSQIVRVAAPKDVSLGFNMQWLHADLHDWVSLYESCRSGHANHFGIVFALSALAYGSPDLHDLLPVLLAVAKNEACWSRKVKRNKDDDAWQISDRFERSQRCVEDILDTCKRPRDLCPPCNLSREPKEDDYEYGDRVDEWYSEQYEAARDAIVDVVMKIDRSISRFTASTDEQHAEWFFIQMVAEALDTYHDSYTRNAELRSHLESVQLVLASQRPHPQVILDVEDFLGQEDPPPDLPMKVDSDGVSSSLTLASVLRQLNPPDHRYAPIKLPRYQEQRGDNAPVTNQLRHVLEEFQSKPRDEIQSLYGREMLKSCVDLDGSVPPLVPAGLPSTEATEKYRDRCRQLWLDSLEKCQDALFSADEASTQSVMELAGVWPSVSAKVLFRQLSTHLRQALPPVWRECIRALCRVYLDYQSSQRLLRFALKGQYPEYFDEYQQSKINNSAMDADDHLLVQIDGDFRARELQMKVTGEMISPSTGHENSVLQLQLGAGKSSVIVPMAAASLADSRTLVRVVVLKQLSQQMFDLLVLRLGNLSDRRVLSLPFSRSVKIDKTNLHRIDCLFKEAARDGAVLVAQPEHILSLKLMTVERSILAETDPDQVDIASKLAEIQAFLQSSARDIFDESDELLHVQYQLIYTAGSQQFPDLHPDRWTIIQCILSLVVKHAPRVRQNHPQEIDIQPANEHGCPIVRLLQVPGGGRASTLLKRCIIVDIFHGAVPGVNVGHITSPQDRGVVIQALTKPVLDAATLLRAEELCRGSWPALLLIRGLLAFDILTFVLRDKRYRVNYGLDPSRSLMAVPYSAKDMPSHRSDYSHLDVAISLTVLSYRYSGLNEDQLQLSFEILLQEDDPDSEYEAWTRGLDIPESLRQLNGINTKDSLQFRDHVLPVFAFNVGVIDFFLSRVVFPKEAREFPSKLATSGWDLAEKKANIVTGFSGTNDRRYLLPTSIKQVDPVQQSSANALVLTHILRPENDHYRVMQDQDGRLTTVKFVERLVANKLPIRVLLDVGAQMLDLQNQELCQHWLDQKPKDVEAAVFFKGDDLSVLTKDGVRGWHVEPFASSPWSHQLDRCIVYLDDAHTRGTDLKLPRDARAAITLGPKVTKDRLVQGAMRMRQLGHGQSVIFFAPIESDVQIRAAASPSIPRGGYVHTLDIVRWVMHETCEDLRHYTPHWVEQGIGHSQRVLAMEAYQHTGDCTQLKPWLTPEARTLEEMYAHSHDTKALMEAARQIPELDERLKLLGVSALSETAMDEEQEREVSHEAERENQVQRPPMATPASHHLSDDLRQFVQTGVLDRQGKNIQPLFLPIRVADHDVWSRDLFATRDFAQTVKVTIKTNPNSYMRPAHWVLSSSKRGTTVLLVISPYEANELLPVIRSSKVVRLHVYRARVIQASRSMSDLKFCVIPPIRHAQDDENTDDEDTDDALQWPILPTGVMSQVNLFAGALYLDDYDTYVQLAAFLGVASPESSRLYEQEQIPRSSDGFIDPALRVMTPVLQPILADFGGKSFRSSPIEALKALTSVRRHGMQYIKTDLGRILHGRQLTQADFRNRDTAHGPEQDDADEDEVYAGLLGVPMDEDDPLAPEPPVDDDVPMPPADFELAPPTNEDRKAAQLGVNGTAPAPPDQSAPSSSSTSGSSTLPRVKTEPGVRNPSPALVTNGPNVKLESGVQEEAPEGVEAEIPQEDRDQISQLEAQISALLSSQAARHRVKQEQVETALPPTIVENGHTVYDLTDL